MLHIDGGTLATVHPEFKIDVLINRSRTDSGFAVRDYAEGLDRDDVFKVFLNRSHDFFNINKGDKDYKNCNEYIEFFLKKRGF